MSITRNFANVTDDGLLYSGITAVETSVGTTDSMLSDALLTVRAATNIGANAISGLNWSRFVGAASEPGSSLSVVFDYDVVATNPTQAITAIRTNSIVPDTVVPPGARLVLKQEVFDSDGNLIGVSLLEKDSSTSDTQDPGFEAGDIQLADAYGAVHVRITLEIVIDATAPPGTNLSFSAMGQTYSEATLPASLGDYVWEDTNANGLQDNGELGIAGVTVELLDTNGAVIGSDTTDASGLYGFDGLAPGDYSVRFVTPNGYVATAANQGGDDADDSDAIGGVTAETNLDYGEHDPTLDAGFYRLAALGDRVWFDSDADGVQEGGENGIAGITVELLDATGTTVLATDTTDGLGNYLFDALTPGSYRVRFDTTGYVQSPVDAGGNDSLDSDAGIGGLTGPYTLASGETNFTVDAGVYILAALGDRVWFDSDADGVQDGGENGIAGIKVDLLDATGTTVLATDTTDGLGNYLFDALTPGTYRVRFDTTGYVQSPVDAGGNDSLDSDAGIGGLTGPYTLVGGETNLTVDAGVYILAALGDRVWFDSDADGVQDGGELGIAGIKVDLLDATGTTVLASDTTDGSGNYLFDALTPGTYRVRFDTTGYVQSPVDAGGNDSLDSDAGIGGLTGPYTLVGGETNLTVDAGVYILAALGDRVWYDTDQDGVQDGGETGVAGVKVELLDATGTTVLATDTTDGSGNYLFDGLTPGDYRVRFETPAGYVQSPVDAGGDDALDSDAGIGGLTGVYTLSGGETDLTVDAGIYRIAPAIQVVKTTNGFSTGAGTDGITLLAGSNVWWNYAVTNSGPVDLTNVVLTDDKEGVITNLVSGDDGDAILEVGETWIYQEGAGTAVLGPYVNNATVTGKFTDGLGTTTTVTDEDPSNYVGVRPAIDIEKYVSVDGGVTFHDADTPTGPSLLEATFSPIFRFVVTNTGGVDLTNLVVSDDKFDLNGAAAGTTVTVASLAIGASTSFDLTAAWQPDQHTNVATVNGSWTDDFGNTAPVTDSDAANYFGEEDTSLDALPVIEVVKTTNGFSAGAGTDGITLLAGSNVWWNYAVSNAGLVPISNVVLTDNKEGVITNLVSGDDGDAILEVGETWIYQSGPGTAVLGPYVNNAKVTGEYTNRIGETKQTIDEDPSNYVGVRPDIDIEKLVSVDGGVTFHDADTPTGPTIAVGGTPIFKFVVTNTGGVDLTNLLVSDDKLDLNGALAGTTVTIASLAVGASTSFDIAGPYEPGQHVNTATVNGSYTDPFGNTAPVTDSDAAHYVSEALTPGIDIEKTTNGSSNSNVTAPDYDNEDAAGGAGVPILVAGSDVTWTYKVTNTGQTNFARADIAIVDDNGTPGSAADDMSVANGMITLFQKNGGDQDDVLEVGENWLYKATGVVQTLTTTGAATTFDFSGSSALDGTDGNSRSYSSGGISVKATAFSRDTAGAWQTGFLGAYGGGLGVTDRGEGDGSGNAHTVDNIGRDNYVLFAFDKQVVLDKAYLGYVVDDSDLRVWIGSVADPSSLVLTDAVLSSLGFTEVNETTLTTARWADLNAGNLAGNVVVIAANTGEPTTEDNFKIEKLTVSASGTGVYENKATVTSGGATDSDLSHYVNGAPPPPPTPGIDIEKTTNGSTNSNATAPTYDNEDAASGAGVPILVAGSDVTWTYKVTNTGNTTFLRSDIKIVDDNGTVGNAADDMSVANGKITLFQKTGGDQDDLLEVGESWLYKATGTVQNLTTPGTATTFDFSGNTATDGTDGNVRSYTSGGVSVKASAFSRVDGSGGAWANAYLGAYGGGLGVTDSGEGTGSGNAHTVDNVGGRDNYVMFRFDQQVVVDKAYLGYVVTDSDVTVWIGNVSNAFNTTISLSDSVLAGLGFTEINDTTLASARWADFNAGNLAGNVLVIAASTADTTPDDNFKIEKLTVATPGQSGTYENKATVTAGSATDSDLSHYVNGAPPPPPTPGIDIEKKTTGAANCNPVAATYDNEDTADGAGVAVFNAGASVTWTYKVTNTGNTTIARNDISIVDDNGTTGSTADDMTIANGKIGLLQKSVGDQDDLLEAGETWLYQATGIAKDLTTWGTAKTFDFSGTSGTDGTDGNVRSYTVGDVSVKASAFSRVDGSGGAWQTGFLGAFGGGLGVTDRGEGSGTGDTHTVDNMGGRDNYVLFRFNQDVVVDKAYLGYVVGDSDVTVWIGNVSNAFNTTVTLSDSLLAGLGFTEVDDTTLSSARWSDFNDGDLSGNVLVIAASTADSTPDDRFKIEKLTVRNAPDVDVYANKATVYVPGASDSDMGHYTNPDIWH